MRVAIYTRVSSEEQVNNFSLSSQKEKMEAFVETQGWTLMPEHFYSDEGLSGVLPIEERPALKSLMEAASRKEFDIVLVYKLDRFFRNTRLLLQAVNKLTEFAVSFKSITESFDTSNPMGQFMLTSLAAVAQLERDNIIDRMELGKDKAARSGVWMGGGVPLGYKLNRETKRLEIEEDEAKIVRLIYQYLLEGNGKTAYYVQTRINALNVPTRFDRTGQEKKSKAQNWWNKRTITRILSNPVYTGEFVYKRKKVAQRSEYKENLNPPEKTIIIETPQLVDKQTFLRAQEILKRNKLKAARNTKRTYLFNRLITCGDCGKAWAGSTQIRKLKSGEKTEHRYYKCTTHNASVSPIRCHQRALNEKRLDEAIWGEILNIISRPEIVHREIKYRLELERSTQVAKKELARDKNFLEQTEGKLKRLKDLYVDGAIEHSEYKKREAEFELEVRRLQDRIEDAKIRIKGLPNLRDFKASVKVVYDRYLQRLYDLKYDDRAFVIHELVSDITYASGQAKMTVLLPSYQLQGKQRMGGIIKPR